MRGATAVLLVGLVTIPGLAAADAEAVWTHLGTAPRLLGDPGGARSRLDELGVELQLFFQTYLGYHGRGGARSPGAVRNSGSYDGFVLADLEELGLLPGGTLLLQFKGNYGRNVNPRVGALSDPIDDADFDEPIWIPELWLDQRLFEWARVRVGYLDQQTVLDRNAFANSEDLQFLSTFLDNNPLVPLRIGIGADLFLFPLPWLELALGTADADNVPRRAGFDTAFDGVDSLMGYFEATTRARLAGPRGDLPGAYRAGFVYDASRRTDFESGDTRRGHFGFYLNFDQLLLREEPDDTQGLGVFGRYGWADPHASRIHHFLSGGFQYEGALPGRDRDVLGLGFYGAVGSKRYRERVDPDFEGETGIELYYKIVLTPWLHVTPDAQLILDPGGRSSARDAVVLVLRCRVAF